MSLVALLGGTILAVVNATPAFAASHTMTILPGSTVPGAEPACSDGVDNDGDGDVDLADGDCVSMNDASESEGGLQVFVPPMVTFTETSGVLSNFDFHFPPMETCVGTFCLVVHMTGDGNASGTWSSSTDTLTLELDAALELSSGVPGWQDCAIEMPDLALSGTLPDGANGSLSGSGSVEALGPGECGGLFFNDYAEILNEEYDLPGTVDHLWHVSVSPLLP